MGHNQKSLPLLLWGYGMKFLAFLTHSSRVDIQLIDLIKPLIDNGFRMESIVKSIKEMHF